MANLNKLKLDDVRNVDISPTKFNRLIRKIKWIFCIKLRNRHDVTLLTRNGILTFSSKDKTIGRMLYLDRHFEFDGITFFTKFLTDKRVFN